MYEMIARMVRQFRASPIDNTAQSEEKRKKEK